MVREKENITYGMAYLVDSKDRQKVIETLDYREKGGYSRHVVEVIL